MEYQENPGWSHQSGQSPPPGQPPGFPPGSAPGVSPAPPYGPPPGGAFGAPPGSGASPSGWSPQPPPAYPPPGLGAPYAAPPPYGAPPSGMPPGQTFPPGSQPGYPHPPGPSTPPPYLSAPYGQPGYGAVPTAPVSRKRRSPWPIIGAVGALIVFGVIAVVVWYARLSPSVSKIEFAHNFQDNKAVNVTDTFKSTDPDLYAIIHLTTAKGSPNVRVVWTVVNGTDAAKRPVAGQEFGQVEKAATSTLLYASVARGSNPWPAGQYKADVFLDGKLAKTAQFTVTA